ncbi:14161_t:CDS:2 [Rhizophagus irregularis]|nr:14161_t:CDS:2 [Rhizophagus irregularis]
MEKLNKTSNFDDACGFLYLCSKKKQARWQKLKVEVLVTGEGTGLGKMTSKSFIKNGAKFYISSKILEEAATGLNRSGECIPITADITIKEKCQ